MEYGVWERRMSTSILSMTNIEGGIENEKGKWSEPKGGFLGDVLYESHSF